MQKGIGILSDWEHPRSDSVERAVIVREDCGHSWFRRTYPFGVTRSGVSVTDLDLRSASNWRCTEEGALGTTAT